MGQLFRGYEAVKLICRICLIRSTWNCKKQAKWFGTEYHFSSVSYWHLLQHIIKHETPHGTRNNTRKEKCYKMQTFQFCHKWMIFKRNQLMSYLWIRQTNISECDRQSNSLIRQFSSKVIFIHNCQVCSPGFKIHTWTAACREHCNPIDI